MSLGRLVGCTLIRGVRGVRKEGRGKGEGSCRVSSEEEGGSKMGPNE
jgi:hypothetical protein